MKQQYIKIVTITTMAISLFCTLFLTNVAIAQTPSHTRTLRYSKIKGTVANVFNNPAKEATDPITVCAENVSTKKKICTKTDGKTDSSYELNVPLGDYFVYSHLTNAENDGRAYYGNQSYCLPYNQKAGDYSQNAMSKKEECKKKNPISKPRRLRVRKSTLNYVRPWDDVKIEK